MALLDDLKVFSETYHQYVDACDDLEKKSKRYRSLNKNGVQLWYEQSDNDLIVASRKIEGCIDESERSIEQAKKGIASSNKYAQQASNDLARELDECEMQHQNRIKALKSSWFSIAVGWVFLGPIVSLIVGIIPAALLGVFGVTYYDAVGDVYGLGILACIIAFVYGNVKADNAAKVTKDNAQRGYKQVVTTSKQNAEQLKKHVEEVSQQLNGLKPQARQQKEVAMEQAKLIWADDMVVKGKEIQTRSVECDQLYNELLTLGTIPSECDWPAVDDVIDKISSGRADGLKEALLLIDVDERHRETMSMQAAQLSERVKLRKQLKVDVANLTRQVEMTRDEIQRQHTADRAQRDYQHAQQMAAEAAQIAIQAAAYREQCKFHNEARQQPQYKPVP